MGKTAEKIIYSIIIVLLTSAIGIVFAKSTLLNEKASTVWVESRDDRIYEYVNDREKIIRSDFNNRIDKLEKMNSSDHEKLERYLIEILKESRK